MAYSIKVDADLSGFRRDMTSLAKEIEKVGSKNKRISLFDKETKNFLEKSAKQALGAMREEISKIEGLNRRISDELKVHGLAEADIAKKQSQIIANKKKMLELERDIVKTSQATSQVLGKPFGPQPTPGQQFKTGFTGAIGGIAGMLGKVPGIDKILKAGAAGGGGMGMLGGLAGGGLLAAGAGIIGRGFNAYQKFDENKESMIKMMSLGFSEGEASLRPREANRLGMNAEDFRNLRIGMTEVFGRRGATADKAITMQATSLGMGIGTDQLLAGGNAIRSQLGISQGAKTFAKLQATLISTELEGSVGPWFETTANMLTQINEHGIGLDSAALAVMSSFAKAGGLSPEMTQRVFSGIDEAMRNAQGENAAFFMSALTNKGIGAGSLGAAQIAMSQGLFGGDADKLRERGFIPKNELDELQRQGVIAGDDGAGVGAFQKRASGITELFNKITAGMGASGKALISSKLTGIKDPLAAREAMGILQSAATRKLTKDERKRLNDLQKGPEEQMLDRLKNIDESTAGSLKASQKFKDDMSELLGQKLAPLGEKTNLLLGNIDKLLAKFLGFLGIEDAKSWEESVADRAAKGDLSMSEYTSLSPEDQSRVRAAINQEIQASTMRQQYADSSFLDKAQGAIRNPTTPFKEFFGTDAKVEGQRVDRLMNVLEKIAAHTASTAISARKPKNTQVQGSGKTRGE